jgi:hypothetical protein
MSSELIQVAAETRTLFTIIESQVTGFGAETCFLSASNVVRIKLVLAYESQQEFPILSPTIKLEF